jgi:hypothetical protein
MADCRSMQSPGPSALRIPRSAILTAVLLFLSLVFPSSPRERLLAEPRNVFAVGVMRRDGFVVPFAQYDGKRWGSSWPRPKLDLQIPITPQAVPKGWWGPTPPVAEWQVWPASKAPEQRYSARVTQLDWVQVHCVRQVALRTDYRSNAAVPPPSEQPYPKDGLAISTSQPLLPIEILLPGAAERVLTQSGLRRRFNAGERETELTFGHPIGRRVRENIEPTVEAVYAFGGSPRAYYVEASRLYRKVGNGECTSIAFATGWLVDDGRNAKWADMAVDLLPCNKYGATFMLPFGVLSLNGRLFWIAQYSGWDYERYVVVELKKDKVEAVVSAWGGGC